MVAGKKLDRALMHRNNTKLVLAAIRNAGGPRLLKPLA